MILYYLDQDSQCIGTITVVNGVAVGTGVGTHAAELNVVEPETLAHLTPKDGDRWLEALRYEYRSPYLRLVYESFMDEEGIPKPVTEAQKQKADTPTSPWKRTMSAMDRILNRKS